MDDRTRNMLVWPVAGFFVVIAFGVGMISMAAFDNDPPSAVSASAEAETVDVELGDLFVEPKMIYAPAGEVTFKIHNSGGTDHNFVIEGVGSSEMVGPDETIEWTVGLDKGDYTVICAVPGHAEGGMQAQLRVGSDMEPASDGAGVAGAMSGMSAQEMVKHDAERTGMFPAETEGKGGVPLEPEILDDGTKRFELTASEIQWETEPGVFKTAYAYNGIVPGPRIDVNEGDKIEFVLKNELPEPTTVHFHGQKTPNSEDGVPAITQDAVMPGDTYTYRFTAEATGSHMYHSHFNAVAQVPMGLLGAFIVHPDNEVAVDQDYVMVLNDGPLGFTLNGKGFPATEPIVTEQGDLIRIRYMNEGMQIHPMHLHGIPQKVVAKDDFELDSPYWADTVLVGPGERFDVLVKATDLGAWAFHCHVLSHAEGPDGMFGMVTALIVQ
ncbi:MAG: multicopper oxidase domain-containing protein [Actinomycetota bacterium]